MEELKSFGLTGYEIKIYTSLLKQGRLSAKDVASFSGVPPTAVYPNLKELENKGLIKSFGGEIKLFEVVSPSIALKHLAKKQADNLLSLEKKLSPKLSQLKNSRVEKVPDPVELSAGAQASLDLMYKLISQASDHVYILGWGFRKVRSLDKIKKVLKSLAKKNIEVRIIFGDKNERTTFLYEECKKIGLPVRYYPMNNCSIVVADGECKLTLKRSDLPQRVNIHIVDEHLVSAFSNYAILLWEKSYLFE